VSWLAWSEVVGQLPRSSVLFVGHWPPEFGRYKRYCEVLVAAA